MATLPCPPSVPPSELRVVAVVISPLMVTHTLICGVTQVNRSSGIYLDRTEVHGACPTHIGRSIELVRATNEAQCGPRRHIKMPVWVPVLSDCRLPLCDIDRTGVVEGKIIMAVPRAVVRLKVP